MQYGIWIGVVLQLALCLLFGLKATLIVNALMLALTFGGCLWESRAATPESDGLKPAGEGESDTDPYSRRADPALIAHEPLVRGL